MILGSEVFIQGGLLNEGAHLGRDVSRSAASAPKTVIVPSVGWDSPVMDFIMVVFPEPLGPSSPTTWPLPTEKVMFLAPRPLG